MGSSLVGLLLLLPPLEMFLGARGPEMLARLARIPVVRRESIPLPPAARQALTVHSEALGYRDAASGEIDLSALPGSPAIKRDDHKMWFHLDRGQVVALGLSRRRQRWGTVVKIDVHAEDNQLVLRSGYYPVGVFGALCLIVFWYDWHLTPWSVAALLAVVLFVVAVMCRTGRRTAHTLHAVVAQELRTRVAALGPPGAPAPLRIQSSAEVEEVLDVDGVDAVRKSSSSSSLSGNQSGR